MKKNVLFVNDILIPGGTEKILIDIITNLDKTKYNVSVATMEYGDWDRKLDGIVEEHIYLGRKYNDNILHAIYGAAILTKSTFKKVSKIYDCVVIFKQGCYYLEKLFNAKVKILWVHEDYTSASDVYELANSFKGYILRPYKRFFVRNRFDNFVAVSQSVADGYKKYFDIKAPFVIYNGIDIDDINQLAKEELGFAWQSDKKYITTISTLSKGKNISAVIEAFDIILSDDDNTRLIIGGKGEMDKELRQLVEERKLEGKVIFLGKVDNPYYYMARSNVFVTASLYESFGLATAEAMCLGTPVVSYANEGVKNIIVDNVGGIITDMNVDAFVDAIKKIIFNDEYRDKLSKEAVFVTQKFNIHKCVKNVEAFLDATMEEN